MPERVGADLVALTATEPDPLEHRRARALGRCRRSRPSSSRLRRPENAGNNAGVSTIDPTSAITRARSRGDVRAEHRRVPTRRPDQTEHAADRGRLARAVRTEEPEHTTLGDLEVEPGDGDGPAALVLLAEPGQLDDRHRAGRYSGLPSGDGSRRASAPPGKLVVRLLDELAGHATAPTIVEPLDGWQLRASPDAPFRRANSVLPNGALARLDLPRRGDHRRRASSTRRTNAHRGSRCRRRHSRPTSTPCSKQRGYEIEAPVVVMGAGATIVLGRTTVKGASPRNAGSARGNARTRRCTATINASRERVPGLRAARSAR